MSELSRDENPLTPVYRVSEEINTMRLRELRERYRASRGKRGRLARRFGLPHEEELARAALPQPLANPALSELAAAAARSELHSSEPPLLRPELTAPPPQKLRALPKLALLRSRQSLMSARAPDELQLPSPLDQRALAARWAMSAPQLSKAEYLLQREAGAGEIERMLPLRICLAEELLRGDRDWVALADWNNRLISQIPIGSRVICYERIGRDVKSERSKAVGAFDVYDLWDLTQGSPPELWDQLAPAGAHKRFELEMIVAAWGGRVKILRLCNPTRIRLGSEELGFDLGESLGGARRAYAYKDLTGERFAPLLRELWLEDYEWAAASGGAYPPRQPLPPNRTEEISALRDAGYLSSARDPRAVALFERYGGPRAGERRLAELIQDRRVDRSSGGGEDPEAEEL